MTTWNLVIAKRVGVGAVALGLGACVPTDPPIAGTETEGEESSSSDTGFGPSSPTSDDTGIASNTGDTTETSEPTSTTDPVTSTTVITSGGICGDGVVDEGEVCDDGTNDGSYGGCMADCSALGPACGDAEVNGPEVCDDGTNDGSYGGCASDCAALGPFCGDGTMDDVEACDDGNDIDDDECSNACALPVCGDGIVQASTGEVCDDMVNDGSYGGCASDCLTPGPFCGDGNVDVDFETCDDLNADNQDGCLANCTAPKNCKEILDFDAAAPDGVYGLSAMDTTWQAYCDMVTNGGGWTLAAKVAPTASWEYGAALWTNATLLQPGQPNFDHTAAKLATWNVVPFTEILVGMEAPNMPNQNPPQPAYVSLDIGAQNSLLEVFSADTYVPTTLTPDGWKTLVPNPSLQDNCNQEGINNTLAGNNPARVRIGILANNDMNCDSAESAIGLGLDNFATLCMNNPYSSVGNLNCGSLVMPVKVQGFGYIFVR